MLNSDTIKFSMDNDKENATRTIIKLVHEALQEKGYNPISQIVGYILSGDPTYITSHNGARSMITSIERDELLEFIVKEYLDQH